jgi:hypothetical protein
MNFLSLFFCIGFLLLLAATMMNSSDRSKHIDRSRSNKGYSRATAFMASPMLIEVVSPRQPTGP